MLQELQQIKDFSDEIAKCIQESTYNDPDIQNDLKALAEQAKKLSEKTQSPIKVGIVGEYSAGKSLLLGALLGLNDILPVSANATTGNITAIHLKQTTEDKTFIGQFNIHYMSENAVLDCMKYMLAQLHTHLQKLKNINIQPLETFMQNISIQSGYWMEIIDWLKATKTTVAYDMQAIDIITETLSLAFTYVRYEGLCDKRLTVDKAVAEKAMQLQEIDTEKAKTDRVNTDNIAQQPNAEIIADSFFLIRHCSIDVHIAKNIWDIQSFLGENSFILLDFPGLGAKKSAIRDRFLCVRELKEVQTILVLLNGQRPDSNIPNEFPTMMQESRSTAELQDTTLVAVGRFDQLPLSTTELDKIKQFVKPSEENQALNIEAITEEDIKQALPTLNRMLKNASEYIQNTDHLSLISSMHHFASEKSNIPEIKKFEQDNIELLQDWHTLAQKISSPNSILKKYLENYTKNGGINKLRTLLAEHVQKHGLKQLLRAVKNNSYDLERQKQVLIKNLKNFKQENIPNFEPIQEARRAIIELISFFKQKRHEYKTNPPQLCIREAVISNKIRCSVTLSDEIKGSIAQEIFAWEEWLPLWNSVEEGFIVLKKQTPEIVENNKIKNILDDDEIIDNNGDKDNEKIVVKSIDFLEPFLETCHKTLILAKQQAELALKLRLKSLNDDLYNALAEYQSILQPLLSQETKQNFENLDESKKTLKTFYKALQQSLQLENLQEKLFNSTKFATTNIENEEIISWFPMPKDKEHPKYFGWHPDMPKILKEAGLYINSTKMQNTHFVYPAAFRNEFIFNISKSINELISDFDKEINNLLIGGVFEILQKRLSQASSDRNFMACLTGQPIEKNQPSSTIVCLENTLYSQD